MRRSHPDPEVESYIRKAERDLATATRMSESGRDFADVICFHAEQCAEKALKGLILALGQPPTYRTFYQGAQGENRRFGREIGEFRRGMGTVGELPGRNGQFPCDRGGNSPTVPIAEATYGILTPRWAQPAARPETLRAYEDPD